MQYFYQCVIHVLSCIIYNSPEYIYSFSSFHTVLYKVLSKKPNQNYYLTNANYNIAKKRAKYRSCKKYIFLKVVGNEKEGGREAGYCLKMVSDHGDQCLFTF
jgi:hypothetical protein